MSRSRLLQENHEPIKVVPDAQREVWFKQQGWRCDHIDGRGRCTSRQTRGYWNFKERRAESYCEKHAPAEAWPYAAIQKPEGTSQLEEADR